MSGIGGLDVSYGARHQIVRTNVAVVKTATTAPTEAQMKSIADLLDQGLSHTMLAPDFVVAMSAANTPSLATTTFQVDTTGNGSVDSTTVSKGPLLRNAGQTPLARGSSTGASADLTAIGSLLGDTTESASVVATTVQSGNLVLEAVLNVGAVALSATAGTATATAFGVDDDTAGSNANDLSSELTLGTTSPSGIYSAALASAVSQMEDADDYKVAGHPEGQVGLLDLNPLANVLVANATGVDMGSGNLATLLSNHATNGRAQAGTASTTSATFTNLLNAAGGSSTTVGAATGIVSCVSIAKVL